MHTFLLVYLAVFFYIFSKTYTKTIYSYTYIICALLARIVLRYYRKQIQRKHSLLHRCTCNWATRRQKKNRVKFKSSRVPASRQLGGQPLSLSSASAEAGVSF